VCVKWWHKIYLTIKGDEKYTLLGVS